MEYKEDYMTKIIFIMKKLINPLFSMVCVLQLGGNVCTLEHIKLVYNQFSMDQHGLREKNVDRKNQ